MSLGLEIGDMIVLLLELLASSVFIDCLACYGLLIVGGNIFEADPVDGEFEFLEWVHLFHLNEFFYNS